MPPPPLKAFVDRMGGGYRASTYGRNGCEEQEWSHGRVDARTCVHCGELTFAGNATLMMQSNFKSPPPPFMEEMQREMRVVVQNADHIVLMGYSLPPDDVTYRAFFAARQRRRNGDPVRCSVVVGHELENRWMEAGEWQGRLAGMPQVDPPRTTLEAAGDLFGADNVRFFGGGIPQVLLEGGRVTDGAVNRLLDWPA